jgi:hypothetical protein
VRVNAPVAPLYAPSDRAARWVKGLMVATLVLTVVAIISEMMEIGLLSRVATGGVPREEALANDLRQGLIALLRMPALVGTAIAFLIWFHRVHKNLAGLGGRGLKYSPGWAVGGFFVPFLNLVRPLQVMREVWHGSDPSGATRDEAPEGPALRNALGTPALIGWWWGLYLVSSILGGISARMSFHADPTIAWLQAGDIALVASDLVDIPGALVAMRLVGRITGWQSQRRYVTGSDLGDVAHGSTAACAPVE